MSAESVPRRRFLARALAAIGGGAWFAGRPRAAAADVQSTLHYVAEVRIFAGNFAPSGWLLCHGQVVLISTYETLFNLIGTTYGGDGQTTFAIPDLRGRAPIHAGSSAFGTFQLGESGGVETVTLTTSQIPAHVHAARASSVAGTSLDPAGRVPARNAAGDPQYAATTSGGDLGALIDAGGGQPHNNMQPFQALNFIIAYEGVFPSQT